MPERIATPIEQAIHTPMLASELETLKQPETPIKALPEKEVIIWTPRFMVTFALLAVIWLSAGSLIAQGLQNHLPFLSPNSKILLVETTFVFGGWITLLFTSRNTWLRLGSICGGAWGVLSLLNFALRTFTPHLDDALIAYFTTAPSIVLLGTYACLSIHRTPIKRWDSYFVALLPLVGALVVLGLYFFSPLDARSLENIESWMGITARCLGIAIWWLRPSCWKTQTSPTILFGLASLLSLLFSIPKLITGADSIFLPQVAMLCFFLALCRLVQGELRHQKHTEENRAQPLQLIQ
ncbi:hypothetical protein [Ktedonobacter racemifer]|uniref:Uncharacterized protein n=1 Tax=Ktedonobacter racemifer DSM 44963 TaxID=485913 RepID=D6TI26_KTERA|nr:hypothetical protein [Ktedonobacter racemifer]EFH89083.1 hypothetical protein Krac_10610 [Ktedonobacter racemifer DSM 44963]